MKTKYVPSIIQTSCECFICHKPYTVGLDHHHCPGGRGLRKLADEDGLWVWLCRECHSLIHYQGEVTVIEGSKLHRVTEQDLKAEGQRAYIKEFIKKGVSEEVARDYFRQRYGRFYD